MIAETIHTKTPDRFLKQKPTKDAELPLAIPDWKQIVALLSSSPCWILQLDLPSSTVSHPLLTLSRTAFMSTGKPALAHSTLLHWEWFLVLLKSLEFFQWMLEPLHGKFKLLPTVLPFTSIFDSILCLSIPADKKLKAVTKVHFRLLCSQHPPPIRFTQMLGLKASKRKLNLATLLLHQRQKKWRQWRNQGEGETD